MEITYDKGTVVALGNFDGLHVGHMEVINAAKKMAEDLSIAASNKIMPYALIFTEHPMAVLTGRAPKSISTADLREEDFEIAGINVRGLDFKSLCNMSPEDFFGKIILEMMNAKGVCCGFNYSFGKNGAGTPKLLETLCKAHGIAFSVSAEADYEGEPISSTRIRKEIESGNIESANAMLGRPFTYRQLVVDGDKRGRKLGTPTINQFLSPELVEPKHGVYMSQTVVNNKTYYSVTNIGTRPTIGNGPVSSETYILDFEGNLYGQYVDVSLLSYLRPERRFPDLPALEAQIKSDADFVRKHMK